MKHTSQKSCARLAASAAAAVSNSGGGAGRAKCCAFTLIELLVVIAIIAILTAMLLSALSRTRGQADKAVDLNNLKQIMAAVQMYASDHHDVLPPPNWDNGGGPGPQGTNAGWLYTPNRTGFGDYYRLKTGLLWPTLKSAKLYLCPGDDPETARFSNLNQQVQQRDQRLSSYAMNGAVIGYAIMKYPPVRLTLMKPTDCAFWETDETEPAYFNDGANYPAEGVSGRHVRGGIQAAFDGSISYVKLDQWVAEVADPRRNRLWCYPLSPDGR